MILFLITNEESQVLILTSCSSVVHLTPEILSQKNSRNIIKMISHIYFKKLEIDFLINKLFEVFS